MWCPGTITMNDEIRWWKETEAGERVRLIINGEVIPDFEGRMSFDTTTGILTIHDAHLRDGGVYWCSVGFETIKVQLTVFERPSTTTSSTTTDITLKDNASTAQSLYQDDDETNRSADLWRALFIVAVVTIFFIIAAYILCVKARNQLLVMLQRVFRIIRQRCRPNKSKEHVACLPANITTEKSFQLLTKAAEIEVRGLAYLDGLIYILQAASQSISVYRMGENSWQPEEITSTKFVRPQDIAACSSRHVLYILDQSCIWQVKKNGDVSEYVRLSQVSATMSVTKKHLLVISSKGVRKWMYSAVFKPTMSEFRLPVGMTETKPWHAVEVDDGHVVAHTETAKYHRVSKIMESQRNKSQLEVFTYGREVGQGEDQLSSPVYLAVEPQHGCIFVADHDNSRVVVLDSNLGRVLTIIDLPEGCYPSRLCYVEERSVLLVGMSNGWIVGYKITWQPTAAADDESSASSSLL